MTDTQENLPPPPPSLRLGSPKDIGAHAQNRKRQTPYHVESFAKYLSQLKDDQQSLFTGNAGYKKKSLHNQMDLLDAMFTYLAVHADWKKETPQSYNAALRAQKQFCDTMKTIADLKKNPASKSSPSSPTRGA